MALAAVKPWEAAAVSRPVVLKGVGGFTLLSVDLISLISAVSSRRERAPWASSSLGKRSLACKAWKISSPLAQLIFSVQKGVETNALRSFSLSTMRARVGLWTRPTERKCLPSRVDARLMNLVRLAPHMRSISCLASPAEARS